MVETVFSISSFVLSLLSENLREERALLLGKPIPKRTWEGLKLPEEQAEPREAMIPF
jgi:hypothetical protein